MAAPVVRTCVCVGITCLAAKVLLYQFDPSFPGDARVGAIDPSSLSRANAWEPRMGAVTTTGPNGGADLDNREGVTPRLLGAAEEP